MSSKKIFFVTGTDTGVGKTLFTALLLHHLRQKPGRTLAMKPFCSGGLGDVRLLQSLQAGELKDSEMNPFYFAQPVAPLVAKEAKKPVLTEVLRHIAVVKKQCNQLIIEGSGGLLVPLGKGYTVADLIEALDCRVVVIARNKLGTINHTLLTVNALRAIGLKVKNVSIVVMDGAKKDISCATNRGTIASLLPHTQVLGLPYLGKRASSRKNVMSNTLKLRKILEEICGKK